MAVAAKTEPLTYEQYLAEGEIRKRYDIINGVRHFMPGPKWKHQRIGYYITEILHRYEKTSQIGLVVSAPFDVLIRRRPLQVRQPDVLFITHAQLEKGGGIPEEGVLEVAPELVVEIISPSETARILSGKLADYCEIGVQECWVVHSDTQTVEVLRLTQDGTETVATYQSDQTLQSAVFPDLTVPVVEIFAS